MPAAAPTQDIVFLVVVGVVILGLAALHAFCRGMLSLYIQSRFSGAPVSFRRLVRLRIKRINARTVVYSAIRCHKARIAVGYDELECHAAAGGNPSEVASALIAGKGSGVRISFEEAAALDLSGHSPLEWVRDQQEPEEPEPLPRPPWAASR